MVICGFEFLLGYLSLFYNINNPGQSKWWAGGCLPPRPRYSDNVNYYMMIFRGTQHVDWSEYSKPTLQQYIQTN